jgi:hypothetical protein
VHGCCSTRASFGPWWRVPLEPTRCHTRTRLPKSTLTFSARVRFHTSAMRAHAAVTTRRSASAPRKFCGWRGASAGLGVPFDELRRRHGMAKVKFKLAAEPIRAPRPRGASLWSRCDALQRHPCRSRFRVSARQRAGYRCLFLDVVSAGTGGPDFRPVGDRLVRGGMRPSSMTALPNMGVVSSPNSVTSPRIGSGPTRE